MIKWKMNLEDTRGRSGGAGDGGNDLDEGGGRGVREEKERVGGGGV